MEPDEREKAATDLLEGFIPDLLTVRANEGFVRRLFAGEPGRWVAVRTLCEDVPGADAFFRSLDALADTDLYVVWLDHPAGPGGHAFIQFYLERYFWKCSAIVDRGITEPKDMTSRAVGRTGQQPETA